LKKEITVASVTFNVPMFSKYSPIESWDEIVNGTWEPQTFKILGKFVGNNDFVFEVGVDGAQTTLFTAAIAGGILALDPMPESIQYLQSCIDINPSFNKKITPVHGALSNKRGKTMFAKGSELFDDVHFTVSDHKVLVETYLIDDIENMFQAKITFINMDIEGGEYICLPPMINWLEKRKPKLLLSLHPGFLMKKSSKFNLKTYKIRFLRQLELFNCLSIFPYIYDLNTSKQITPLALFRIKFLQGKNGRDLQILCSFNELYLDETYNQKKRS
jgi:FkbM family methyltransferase